MSCSVDMFEHEENHRILQIDASNAFNLLFILLLFIYHYLQLTVTVASPRQLPYLHEKSDTE